MPSSVATDPFADLLPPLLPKRFSVSMIGSSTQCMLRMRLDRETSVTGVFATIGSAAHEVFGTCEFRAQLAGLSQMYPSEAEAIAHRVLGHPERPAAMTAAMYNYVVDISKTWAGRVVFPLDADTWVIEHPFRIPIVDHEEGVTYTLSGRMDEYAIWGTHYRVRDWKTGPGLPTQRQVEEEHSQLQLYALAAFHEFPFLETFECTEFYTRAGVPRTVELTREHLEDLRRWLISRCRTIVKAYHSGRFEATPGERWCNTCPMPRRCPLPEQVRPASILRTEDEAREQIEAWLVEDARKKQRQGAVRGFLEAHTAPTIEVGGKEYGFVPKKERKLNEARLAEILEQHGLRKDDLYETEEGVEFGNRRK